MTSSPASAAAPALSPASPPASPSANGAASSDSSEACTAASTTATTAASTAASVAAERADVTQPVGIIGIGNMGFAMLERLRSLGIAVFVHDINPQRCAEAASLGAQVLISAADVARAVGTGVVIVAVVDATQTFQVLFGEAAGDDSSALASSALVSSALVEGATPGLTVLLCPTLGPQTVEEAARCLAEFGIGMLDAPMSGGPQRAREGRMSLMLAGPAALRNRLAPLLNMLAQPVFQISERIGDGARTKLVNNLLAAINLAGAAECLALAQQMGLNARDTLAVIQQSSGQSWIGQDRMSRALAGDFAPRAHTLLLAKDSALALEAASSSGSGQDLPKGASELDANGTSSVSRACEDSGPGGPTNTETIPLGRLAAQIFASACAEGLAELDDASLFLRQGGRPEPAP